MDDKFLSMFLTSLLKGQGINVGIEQSRTIALRFIAGIAYYLYSNPQIYLDLGKYAIYRGCRLDNLLTVEAKNGENAQSIQDYYEAGGLQLEQLQGMITTFAKGLLTSASESQQDALDEIAKIEQLTSQRKQVSTQKKKGEK